MQFEVTGGKQIPAGSYTAILQTVEPGDHPTYGPQRRWTFLVQTGPAAEDVTSITAITSTNTGPQSKSFKWLSALLGRAPAAGERLEAPTGSQCVVTITEGDNGFSKVTDVQPYVAPQQTLAGIPR